MISQTNGRWDFGHRDSRLWRVQTIYSAAHFRAGIPFRYTFHRRAFSEHKIHLLTRLPIRRQALLL